MLKKLRRKFVCVLMAVVMVMMGVIFGMVIRFTRENLEQESLKALQQAAGNPGFLPGPRDEGAQPFPYFIISGMPDGTLQVTGTINPETYGQDQLMEFWNTVSASREQTGILAQYDLRYLRNTAPMGTRVVFLDISSQRLAMESLQRVCFFVAMVMLVVMFGLSVLLARWLVKPVEQAWQQQRQFVADASHELKTPLTVIMTNAELLKSGEFDESARSRFTDSIVTMSHQMRGLVEGLLELARVDNGAVKTNLVPLELSDLMADSILPFEPLFFERGLTLNACVEPGLRCRGSAAHLRQVLEILLDNAMKYTSPGGSVQVSLKRNGNHTLLAVSGPGEVISPEDRKNIFKRFYRVDKARSRDGSYGLGLSIAQSIVEEHGGKIWAESTDGINTFCVQLPVN